MVVGPHSIATAHAGAKILLATVLGKIPGKIPENGPIIRRGWHLSPSEGRRRGELEHPSPIAPTLQKMG